jgi:hypothetical protein
LITSWCPWTPWAADERGHCDSLSPGNTEGTEGTETLGLITSWCPWTPWAADERGHCDSLSPGNTEGHGGHGDTWVDNQLVPTWTPWAADERGRSDTLSPGNPDSEGTETARERERWARWRRASRGADREGSAYANASAIEWRLRTRIPLDPRRRHEVPARHRRRRAAASPSGCRSKGEYRGWRAGNQLVPDQRLRALRALRVIRQAAVVEMRVRRP